MPQPFNNAVMTNAGARLLTRAQAGEVKIEFTRMATGSGKYSGTEKEMEYLQARTGLREEKNSFAISNIEVYSDHSVKVTALISNQNPITGETLVEEGYYINEVGLYAREAGGDSSTEVLYSITTTTGENGDFMPPYNGYNPAQIIQDYYVTVNNSAKVTVKNVSGAVATIEDIRRLETQIKNILAMLGGEITEETIEAIGNGTYREEDDIGTGCSTGGYGGDTSDISALSDEELDNMMDSIFSEN